MPDPSALRFACLTGVAPGETLAARCEIIAAAGCSGVETIIFPHTALEQWQAEIRAATQDAGLSLVAVILGGLALYQSGPLGWIDEALQAIAELGAPALITPEYRAQDPLPLFPPFPAPSPEEQAAVDVALDALSELATRLTAAIVCEPLTQFEGRFWRDVPTTLAACKRLNNPAVGLALDFHNMNITEASLPAAIRAAGPLLRHIHLADNNRRLPGQGHIDFAAGLRALRDVGYGGWCSFECAVGDDFVREVRQAIRWLEQQNDD